MNAMFRSRARRAAAACVLMLLAGVPFASRADTWPERPIKLVVPFPPGGAADIIGRLLAQRLSDKLGQGVVVENRAGAGTIIAAQSVARSKNDGYTLSLATTGQLSVNPALYKDLPYDPVKSFTPVALVASTAYMISVNAESPIRTLQQLIDEAKKRPGALSFSSCGNGTICHLTGELLKSTAGIDLLHIPFSGSAPAITALLGDQVQVASDTVAIESPYVRAGKLRGLVISSNKRSSVAPDVPTAAEAGLPAFLASSWFGIVVPAGTPAPIVQRLNREINAITTSPEVRALLAQQGLDSLQSTPEEFAKQIDIDTATWARVVKSGNITLK